MAYKVFIDTNVFLDAYLERTADWKDAEAVLQSAALEQITLFTSANNLVNTIYALQKQNLTAGEIIDLMELTLTYTQLVNTSNAAFRQALRAGFKDLEDAVQYHTALEVKGIDYFITANIKDYIKATVQLPVLTPKQFILRHKGKGA
ncbi:PIN domain-containing protein [Segetibacter sp. 3557_3]|uniref:type II toxin-antitoxin system VapC family toxin n=1 Tax=Segetibacter sp. 3557_3 TaxID=2547429 RepID=UPI001058B7FD|nr:PIN domain-containing protein [Segetibacter sp. 3557_3]TDH26796.1 PIN domain-containing protein [Segetibacter sp. 3557_3]